MKKSKLSITLVTSFIAAMAMSACNSVSASKEAIVTFKPYGSKESVELITNDVYKQYGNTSAGISKLYDKMLELLIRYQFKTAEWDKGEKSYKEIENYAKNEVQAKKDEASANAKNNGTSYDDEWESILKSNNVEDSKELLQKFIYDEEKRVMKEWYSSNNEKAEELKNEFIGLDSAGHKVNSKVKAAMPYHIRHILVSVDEASDAQEKFYKGTVSEEQARNLYDTATDLASGEFTFSEVAKRYPGDGTKEKGGDLGIVTNSASSGSLTMVNEFQLGWYAYDYKYDPNHQAASEARDAIGEGLGFTDEVYNALAGSITEIPYEAFLNMGKYADVTADKYGTKLDDGNTRLFPRNIVWNKYFNLHNVFVIKNRKCAAPNFGAADANTEFSNLIDDANVAVDPATAPRFNSDGYLTDEKGNVIICVRSQHGLHYIVIEKSMFDYDTLGTYYSTKVPGDEGYSANSYVGFIKTQDSGEYINRANDVKNAINSFDTTYDYRLFDWLTTDCGMTVTYEGQAKEDGLEGKLAQYIDIQRESNGYKQEEGLAKVWKSYLRLLDVQEANRDVTPWQTVNPLTGKKTTEYYTRLVSEQVAKDFYNLNQGILDEDAYKAFAEGGKYTYYA